MELLCPEAVSGSFILVMEVKVQVSGGFCNHMAHGKVATLFVTWEATPRDSSNNSRSSDKHCPALMDFLRSGIYFASVDVSNDKLKTRRSFGIEIPAGCLIDIQDIFRLQYERTSMASMTVALIDDYYEDMKTTFLPAQHKKW